MNHDHHRQLPCCAARVSEQQPPGHRLELFQLDCADVGTLDWHLSLSLSASSRSDPLSAARAHFPPSHLFVLLHAQTHTHTHTHEHTRRRRDILRSRTRALTC
jgi:hypothetical protein